MEKSFPWIQKYRVQSSKSCRAIIRADFGSTSNCFNLGQNLPFYNRVPDHVIHFHFHDINGLKEMCMQHSYFQVFPLHNDLYLSGGKSLWAFVRRPINYNWLQSLKFKYCLSCPHPEDSFQAGILEKTMQMAYRKGTTELKHRALVQSIFYSVYVSLWVSSYTTKQWNLFSFHTNDAWDVGQAVRTRSVYKARVHLGESLRLGLGFRARDLAALCSLAIPMPCNSRTFVSTVPARVLYSRATPQHMHRYFQCPHGVC